MKKNVLFTILYLVFIILLFVYFYINNSNKVKYIEDKTNKLEINIKYPYYKYKKLNNIIDTYINNYVKEIRNTSFNENYSFYTLYIDYKEYLYKNYISTIFYTEIFLGGAHPNHYINTIVYDKVNNTIIDIDYLINNDIVKLNELSSLSREYLSHNKVFDNTDIKDMLFKGTTSDKNNFKRFIFTDKGIIIFFERYQIAPYYFGEYNILIPYEKVNFNI